MSTKMCPACGSTDIKTKKAIQSFYDRFAGDIETEITEDECSRCGMDGDFESVNDSETKHALELLRKNAAQNIINAFVNNGYNLASMERALELPQRTLSKWKNDTPPVAAGLTLLKFIALFPWLLTVADTKFDQVQSQAICVHNAIDLLYTHHNQLHSNVSSQHHQHTTSITIHANIFTQNNQIVTNNNHQHNDIIVKASIG